jgi:hypothetical protein
VKYGNENILAQVAEPMPYYLIVLVGVLALASVFVIAADAALWIKVLVVGLLALSFFWRYGLFLQVAIGVSISLYLTYLKARSA